jgi:exodeoxyribonuclease-3
MYSGKGVSTLKIMSWNVNGIRAIQKRGFLDWVQEAQPDVLALQETKVNDDTLPENLRNIPGYESHFSYASTRRGYSGVAVYSRIGVVSVERSFGVPEWDDEGRHLLVDFGDFTLANVYFPNGRASTDRLDYKMRYYAGLLTLAGKTVADGKNLVICGDYNTAHHEIDLARPRENSKTSGFLPEERAWMDSLTDAGFVDTFRMFNDSTEQYSWWSQRSGARSRNVGWRLDYFFVNAGFQNRVVGAQIHADVQGSDHCPVAIEIT